MKIAIASDDNKTVTGHIGRVRGFIIFDFEDGKIKSNEYRENVFTNHARTQQSEEHEHGHNHEHGHSHESLADGIKDCSHLICASAGWRVVEDLKNYGVGVIFTTETDAETAALKFEKGELEINENGICRAH